MNTEQMDAWKALSAQELERQYSPSQWSTRMPAAQIVDKHIETTEKESAKAKEHVKHTANVAYGSTDIETLDLFLPDHLSKEAPVLLYIHGGYWQELSKDESSYMAKSFTDAGAVVATIEYELAPRATVETIISQCHAAVKYMLEWASKRGSRGLYLCGHSAGGHLVSMMMTYDWCHLLGASVGALLKGVIPVSGVFDLRPISHTYINDPLHLTDESAWKISPLNSVENIRKFLGKDKGKTVSNVDVLLGIAEEDSPEFHRQHKLFLESLLSVGVDAKQLHVPGTDHFSVIEQMSDSQSILTKAIFQLMKL